MKLVLQVAAGVLLALLLYEGVRRYQAQRDLEEASIALAKLAQGFSLPSPPVPLHAAQPAPAVVDREAKWRADNQAAMQRWNDEQRVQALLLKPGEECLGGFQGRPGTIIVRSIANGVSQSVQLVEHGRPVECVGNHRLDKTASQFPKR